jgi:DNA-binding response OmpR family regulator
MRILVVEDDLGIAESIHQGLMEAGYAVDVVGDGIAQAASHLVFYVFTQLFLDGTGIGR